MSSTRFMRQSMLNSESRIPSEQFDFIENIAVGEFGDVALYTWTSPKLPNIHTEVVFKQNAKQRCTLLLSLNHKHLIQCFGHTLDRDNCFALVLEKADRSLSEVIDFDDQSDISDWTRINWMKMLSAAVQYLHQLSNQVVIHKSIKPDSILIFKNRDQKLKKSAFEYAVDFENSVLKLGDLGSGNLDFVRYQHNYSSLTKSFVAPEIFEGTKFNKKTDDFSVALVMLAISVGTNLSQEIHGLPKLPEKCGPIEIPTNYDLLLENEIWGDRNLVILFEGLLERGLSEIPKVRPSAERWYFEILKVMMENGEEEVFDDEENAEEEEEHEGEEELGVIIPIEVISDENNNHIEEQEIKDSTPPPKPNKPNKPAKSQPITAAQHAAEHSLEQTIQTESKSLRSMATKSPMTNGLPQTQKNRSEPVHSQASHQPHLNGPPQPQLQPNNCSKCKIALTTESVVWCNLKFHRECFTCTHCNGVITGGDIINSSDHHTVCHLTEKPSSLRNC